MRRRSLRIQLLARSAWEQPSGTFAFPPRFVGYGGEDMAEVEGNGVQSHEKSAIARRQGEEGGGLEAKRSRASYSRHSNEWERTLLLQSRTRVPGQGKRARERLEELRARVRRRIEGRGGSSGGETLTIEQLTRITANRAAAARRKQERQVAAVEREEEAA